MLNTQIMDTMFMLKLRTEAMPDAKKILLERKTLLFSHEITLLQLQS